MKRDFDKWLNNFKTSIADYTYYVDFEKIYKNVDKVKIELNILNSLIGSANIEEEFKNIIVKYPETLECIPLLLAVHSSEIFIKDNLNEYLFNFEKMIYSIDDYIKFMKESGLFDLLQNHLVRFLIRFQALFFLQFGNYLLQFPIRLCQFPVPIPVIKILIFRY